MSFQRYMIGQDDRKETEPGKRMNRYLGAEADWGKYAFNSQAEVQAAFRDARYESDPDWRDAVAIMLRNSEEHAPGTAGSGIQIGAGALERAMSNKAAARAAEDQAIYAERIQQMFADPRYEKSPSYRREVEDFIRAHEAEIQNAVGHRAIDRTNDTTPVRFQMEGDAVSQARENLKADRKAQAKAEAQDAARSAAREAYFRALGQEDPGQQGEHSVSDEDIFNDDDAAPAPVTA